MKIKINAVKFKVDSKLEELIEKKVEKLKGFYPTAVGATVTLKLDKDEENKNKVVELGLEIPGNNLFAAKREPSFEEALDDCVNAVRRQIEKIK